MREAGKGWMLVQFSRFTHPMSRGWHLMRRKDFRRVNEQPGHYNRIKDELGYTPKSRHGIYTSAWRDLKAQMNAWYDKPRLVSASPTRGMAYDMLEAWREGVGKSVVAAWDFASKPIMLAYDDNGKLAYIDIEPTLEKGVDLATFEVKGKDE